MCYTETILELESIKCQAIGQIQTTLTAITNELIQLVHRGKIISFSFKSNKDYNKSRFSSHYPIVINVATGHREIQLGLYGEFGGQGMTPEIRQALITMNTYLVGANEYLVKYLPSIEISTYYSLKALYKEDGFEEENIILLPAFFKREEIVSSL